jgi:hypothetical protein
VYKLSKRARRRYEGAVRVPPRSVLGGALRFWLATWRASVVEKDREIRASALIKNFSCSYRRTACANTSGAHCAARLQLAFGRMQDLNR